MKKLLMVMVAAMAFAGRATEVWTLDDSAAMPGSFWTITSPDGKWKLTCVPTDRSGVWQDSSGAADLAVVNDYSTYDRDIETDDVFGSRVVDGGCVLKGSGVLRLPTHARDKKGVSHTVEIGNWSLEGWNAPVRKMTKCVVPVDYTAAIGDGTSITADFEVESGNPKYYSRDGALYLRERYRGDEADGDVLLQCPSGKTGSFAIPDNVTKVRSGAFEFSSLSEIVIGPSLEVFESDHEVKDETMKKVTINGNDRFKFVNGFFLGDGGDTVLMVLKSFMKGDVFVPSFVKKIDVCAMAYQERVSSFVFSSPELTIESDALRESANFGVLDFSSVGKLTLKYDAICDSWVKKIYLPENVDAPYGIRLDCSDDLTDVYWPTKMSLDEAEGKGIVFQLDEDCRPFTLHVRKDAGYWPERVAIESDQTMKVVKDIAKPLEWDVSENGDGTVTICGVKGQSPTGILKIPPTYDGKTVTKVGVEGWDHEQGSFANLDITGLVIPEGVTELSCGVFHGCRKLTSVTLPSTLRVIRNNCFEDCTALKSIVLPEGLQRVEFDFLNDTAVSTLVIPSTLVDIEEGALALPAGRKFTVAAGNPRYRIENGYVYDYIDGVVFMRADAGKTVFVIPEGATRIASCCFAGCSNGSVTVPASVKSIGDEAFAESYGIKVTFLGGMPRVDEWNDGVFAESVNAKVYVQPGQGWDNVVRRGAWQGVPVAYAPGAVSFWYDFNADGGITLMGVASGMPSGSWVLPSTYDGYPVTAIGVDFPGTSKESLVTEVVIPASVRVIEDEAFDAMPKLKSVVLNEGLEEIGVDVFLSGKITSIKIPSTVISMGPAAFGQNPLTKIEVAEGNPRYTVTDNGLLIDTWESKLQLSIRNQGNLVIPEGVEVIGCNSLEMVKLSSVDFPQSLRVLEDQAFGTGANKAGNFSFTELDFSRTQLKTVGGFVFVNNTQLKTVRFPATVESLGYWTFAHCSALMSVYFNGGVPEVTVPLNYEDEPEWLVDDLPDLLEYPDGDIYIETVGNPPPRLRNVTTYVTPDHAWEDVCRVGTWQGRPIKMKTAVSVSAVGGGTATGGGSYDSGAKVPLKATPAKGYVFAGWYEKEGLPLEILGADYRAMSVSYVAPARNVEIIAKFVTKAVDEAKLAVANISAGEVFVVDGDWTKQVKVDSHSIPTVSAKGLPTGLKFNAKTLTISGRPTKPGRYDVELSLKNASVKTAKKFAFTVVVPNLKSEFIVGGVDYRSDAYVYIAGTRIDPILPELDEGVTLSASGLPAGLKLVGGKNGVPYSIEGASTAKPGSYTVTFTLKKGAVKETATITVNIENRTLTLGMAVVDGALTNGCKVTGGGSYAAGKKVTLKATAAKNCVFAGWYRDSACTVPVEGIVDFRTASYSYVTKAKNETIYALFMPATEDTGIALVVDGNEVTSDAAETVFNTAGELTLALEVESVSVPKVTVSGLPSGLKFTAKEVLNKDKTVLAAANTIYGTATKPGTYVVTAKLTNTTVKKAIEKKFTIVVDNLTGANELLDVTDTDGAPARLLNASGESYAITNGVVETCLPVILPAESGDKVALSGLPSGLKYNAKTGKIEGAATKAGTFTVQVKVGKAVSTFTIVSTPLPGWAVGTFVGLGIQEFHEEDDGWYEAGDPLESDSGILFTLTIAASGKCSCKATTDYESVSVKDLKLIRSSNGKLLVLGEGAILPWQQGRQYRGEFWLRPINVPGGTVGAADLVWYHTKTKKYGVWLDTEWNNDRLIITVEGFPLLQNVWGSRTLALPTKMEGKEFVLETPDNRGLVLKFGKKGTVTAALWNANASKASVTASGQLSLCGHDAGTGAWNGQVCLILMDRPPNQPGEVGAIVSVKIDASGDVTCTLEHYEYNWR